MKKFKTTDIWVLLLDILSFNGAYYLALLIRFYVNSQLRPVAERRYMPAWVEFTPWYTVICIAVFVLFSLYGGMWRYAGINDMNRIVMANACTTAIHVLGTSIFIEVMPITYYTIGAILQFVFTASIRFAFRVLLVERRRLKRKKLNRIPSIVVGSGESGRRVVKYLEESETYCPVAVLGSETGTMDGLPIIPLSKLTEVADKQAIEGIVIADPFLSSEERQIIKDFSIKRDLEYQDYTGFATNLGGRLSLTELMRVISSPVSVSIGDETRTFTNGNDALKSLTKRYEIIDINGKNILIKLEEEKKITAQEALELAYAAIYENETPLKTTQN